MIGQAMRRFLRIAIAYGMNPTLAEHVPKGQAAEPSQRILTKAERELIYCYATQDVKLLMLLCGDMGLRIGTAADVTAQHWHRPSNTIRINGMKMGGSLVTPITTELEAMLLEIERQTPELENLPYMTRARPPHKRTQKCKQITSSGANACQTDSRDKQKTSESWT